MRSELSSQEPPKIHPPDESPKSIPGPEPASDPVPKAPIVPENLAKTQQPSMSKTADEPYTTGSYPKDRVSPNMGPHKGRVNNL